MTSTAPTPSRITAALDIRSMYGAWVDVALGVQEPVVDEWETGVRVPTHAQIQRLALLTGFPVKFFYLPPIRHLDRLLFVCNPL